MQPFDEVFFVIDADIAGFFAAVAVDHGVKDKILAEKMHLLKHPGLDDNVIDDRIVDHRPFIVVGSVQTDLLIQF